MQIHLHKNFFFCNNYSRKETISGNANWKLSNTFEIICNPSFMLFLFIRYRKVASSNTYVSFWSTCRPFQIAYEGNFWWLCTVTFRQKNIFELATWVSTRDSTLRLVVKNQCLFQFLKNYKFDKARNSTLIMKHISTPKWNCELLKDALTLIGMRYESKKNAQL